MDCDWNFSADAHWTFLIDFVSEEKSVFYSVLEVYCFWIADVVYVPGFAIFLYFFFLEIY